MPIADSHAVKPAGRKSPYNIAPIVIFYFIAVSAPPLGLASEQIAQLSAISDNPPATVSSQAIKLNDAGVRALSRQDFKLAIDKLESALKASPNYKTARENLGIAYNNYGLQLQKKPAESIKQFHRAIYLDPNNETTIANFYGIIGFLKKDPQAFNDRISLAEEAMASRDWFGGVVEYAAALRIREDAQVKSKLRDAAAKLSSYLESSGLPRSSNWDETIDLSAIPASSRIPAARLGSPSALTAANATTSSATVTAPKQSEIEMSLERARELFEQYVLASDSHNPAIITYYARDAVFTVGGSDPRLMTAKLTVPAEQWKERFLSRQRRDALANRKDKFEALACKPDKGGSVRVTFTRTDPLVTAKVEWLVKQDSDRKWRIFEQTELAVPPANNMRTKPKR